MDYLKKVLMLKRTEIIKQNIKPLSVLSRIEIESGVGEFYISVVNLPLGIKGAKYYALVVDSKGRDFEFDLGARPISYAKTFYELPSIEDGVAIGLYYIAEQIPVTLAFASQGSGICLNDFKKIVADKCLLRFKQILKEQEQEITDKEQCESNKTQNESDYHYKEILEQQAYEEYNDEAVATVNYYEIDDEIKQKLRSIKEKKSENLFFENEYADSADKKTEKEKCNFVKSTQDEKNANFSQEDKGLEKTCIQNELLLADNYYDGVKDELEQIFCSYSNEEGLEKIFNESKWAKIFYSKDKFYVVGLIFEQGKEKYICYGVPSRYSKTPPTGLEGYASFIPLSVFDMFGDGYFIMFQDAKTGKCVHFN